MVSYSSAERCEEGGINQLNQEVGSARIFIQNGKSTGCLVTARSLRGLPLIRVVLAESSDLFPGLGTR